MIEAPEVLFKREIYKPILSALDDVYLKTSEVAKRWRYVRHHLENLRRTGKGLPWVELPTGAVRYRASDVIAAEIAGTAGPITLEHITLAVAAFPGADDATKLQLIDHLKKAFEGRA